MRKTYSIIEVFNCQMKWNQLRGIYILLCFNFEFRKSRTIKRDSSTVGQLCNQMLKTTDLYHLTQPKQPAKNLQILPVLARAAVPPYEGGSAAHKRPLGPKRYKYHLGWPTTEILLLQQFSSKLNRPKLTSLSSIVAPSSLKQILDSNHQNLREKAAKLDWREDPLIPKI